MTSLLCLIFCLSGAAALIYEALWFRLLGLSLGNSVWATTMVLSSFMGGLALGNGLVARYGHRIRNPIHLYAYLEMAIGLFGVGLVLLLPILTEILGPFFRAFIHEPLVLNSARAAVAFSLLLVPTTLMGATLPLLVKGLYARRPNFGLVLGILYGWNTFGAVLGVLLTELALVSWLGIRGAGFAACTLNVLAAVMALSLFEKAPAMSFEGAADARPGPSVKFPVAGFRPLAAGFLSGFVLLALEVFWFRFLLLFFNPTGWSFAAMLTVVLAGISLGGLTASRWFKAQDRAEVFLVSAAFFNGLLVVCLYAVFHYVFFVIDVKGDFGWRLNILLLSFFLMFPVSFVSGIIFTMLGKALHTHLKAETKAAGLLTLANTTGGMVGSGMAGLLLMPAIGIEKSFFVLALVYGLIGCLLFEREALAAPVRGRSLQYLVVPLFLVAAVQFPFGSMENIFLRQPILHFAEERVAVREGVTETIQYLQKELMGKPYYHRLVTNSHTMSATTMKAKRYMKMFVYLPAALHPEPRRALLICYGVGTTARALTDEKRFEAIKIVDISRDVVGLSKVVFPKEEDNPIHDPRVDVHIEDGRFFLSTTDLRFDLITAEPPPPIFSGVVNLYSREYFRLVHDRLQEGGFATYWLPVYQLKDAETRAIVRGFCDVFEDCSLWTAAGFEWMLVGTKGARQRASADLFSGQWRDPVVGPEMRALGFDTPEQFGSLFIADSTRLRRWLADSPPLVDNYPRRLSYGDHDRSRYLDGYRALMDPEGSRASFLESAWIKSVWPQGLRDRAAGHFAAREIVNETLMTPAWKKIPPVQALHRCLHDPLLTNCVLWALASDQYAQDIIARSRKEKRPLRIKGVEEFRHVLAGAARQKDYRLAIQYLNLLLSKLPPEQPGREHYVFYQWYFLFLTGEKARAEELKAAYVRLKQADPAYDLERINQCWQWLEENVSAGAS